MAHAAGSAAATAATASNAEQLLAGLRRVLAPLGLGDAADAQVLHPGQRREKLVRGLATRLLGGLSVEDIKFAAADSLDDLAEDERFAQKCRSVLTLLGITASAEQIRGCSGSPEQDTALLLQMAQLLHAMERHRAGAGRPRSDQQQQQQQQQQAPPSDAAVTQLLAHACVNVGKLTSDAAQLFASDMSDALRAYSDQGALQQLPSLSQQVALRSEQLHAQLQRLLDAGGRACEGAGGEAWQQQVAALEAATQGLLQEMQHFDAMYTQELSVWAGVATEPQQAPPGASGAPAGSATMHVAQSVGKAAAHVTGAFQGLRVLLDALGSVRAQHAALQDVPAAQLQEQRATHSADARRLHSFASTLRVAAPIVAAQST